MGERGWSNNQRVMRDACLKSVLQIQIPMHAMAPRCTHFRFRCDCLSELFQCACTFSSTASQSAPRRGPKHCRCCSQQGNQPQSQCVRDCMSPRQDTTWLICHVRGVISTRRPRHPHRCEGQHPEASRGIEAGFSSDTTAHARRWMWCHARPQLRTHGATHGGFDSRQSPPRTHTHTVCRGPNFSIRSRALECTFVVVCCCPCPAVGEVARTRGQHPAVPGRQQALTSRRSHDHVMWGGRATDRSLPARDSDLTAAYYSHVFSPVVPDPRGAIQLVHAARYATRCRNRQHSALTRAAVYVRPLLFFTKSYLACVGLLRSMAPTERTKS